MMRILLLLLIMGGLLFVAVRVLHIDAKRYIPESFKSETEKDRLKNDGVVLGTTEQKESDTFPALFSQTIQTVSSAITGKSEEIEVDYAVQQIKQEAMSIPGKVFEQAKYTYCKQVIQDYESRN